MIIYRTIKKEEISKCIDLITDSYNGYSFYEIFVEDKKRRFKFLKEIQKVYKSQGVDVSDKHVETVVRRMITKIKVVDPGDTNLIEGLTVPLREFAEINKPVILSGGVPATGKPIMLGITKASLETDSFLSAASKKPQES